MTRRRSSWLIPQPRKWSMTRTGARINGQHMPRNSRLPAVPSSTSRTTPVRMCSHAVLADSLAGRPCLFCRAPCYRRAGRRPRPVTAPAPSLTPRCCGIHAALEVIVIVAIVINTITLAVQVRAILLSNWFGLRQLTRCARGLRTPAISLTTRIHGSTRSWTSSTSF